MTNKTIKEFADELGISKSKVHYQVSKLNSDQIVILNGIKYLTNAVQKEIAKNLGVEKTVELDSELNDFKHQIEQLEMQLSKKDEQIATLHNLLDQQQQLQLKAQLLLEEKNLLIEQKNTDSSNAKWYQFWK
ncbi:DUF536 domain-containing protein [Enterococcus faecium]|jgi:DNA-binding Lrp family transcriptional regulator|nr:MULTISPECIES: DUF536 domain-containing protein [Enterococcus]MCA6733684.1 DUF536 domain-containing protein [Enterococcus lactis]MCA6736205.1 DUF536 domain-containing protein [Enterococcus lactis]MCA6738751.1 DUF536 domain-containing protein [Enterococcus lactis]MCA6754335.1 DUF536 domain-containing protein [Enterococcus lactis]MCA6762497.1 DUF536 domain-containing protein [Enterococcus lactis]